MSKIVFLCALSIAVELSWNPLRYCSPPTQYIMGQSPLCSSNPQHSLHPEFVRCINRFVENHSFVAIYKEVDDTHFGGFESIVAHQHNIIEVSLLFERFYPISQFGDLLIKIGAMHFLRFRRLYVIAAFWFYNLFIKIGAMEVEPPSTSFSLILLHWVVWAEVLWKLNHLVITFLYPSSFSLCMHCQSMFV